MENRRSYKEFRYIEERKPPGPLSDCSSFRIHNIESSIDSDRRRDVRSSKPHLSITENMQHSSMNNCHDLHIHKKKDSFIRYPPITIFNTVNNPFSASTSYTSFAASTNLKPFSVSPNYKPFESSPNDEHFIRSTNNEPFRDSAYYKPCVASTNSEPFSFSKRKCYDKLTEFAIDKRSVTIGIEQQVFSLEKFFLNYSPNHWYNQDVSCNNEIDNKQCLSSSFQQQTLSIDQPESYQNSLRHLSTVTESPSQVSNKLDKRCTKQEYQDFIRQHLSRVTKSSSQVPKELNEQSNYNKVLQNDHRSLFGASKGFFPVSKELDGQSNFKAHLQNYHRNASEGTASEGSFQVPKDLDEQSYFRKVYFRNDHKNVSGSSKSSFQVPGELDGQNNFKTVHLQNEHRNLSTVSEHSFQVPKDPDEQSYFENFKSDNINLSRTSKSSLLVPKELDGQSDFINVHLRNDHSNVSEAYKDFAPVPTTLGQQDSFKKDDYQRYQDFIREHLSKVTKNHSPTEKKFEQQASSSNSIWHFEQPHTSRVPVTNCDEIFKPQLPSTPPTKKFKRFQEYVHDGKLLQQPNLLSKTQRKKLRKHQISLERAYGFQTSSSHLWHRKLPDPLSKSSKRKLQSHQRALKRTYEFQKSTSYLSHRPELKEENGRKRHKKNQPDKYCTIGQTHHQQLPSIPNNSVSVQDLRVISNQPSTKLLENENLIEILEINSDDEKQIEMVSIQSSNDLSEPEIIVVSDEDEEDRSELKLTHQLVENNCLLEESNFTITSQPVNGSELSLTSQPVENNSVINGSELSFTSQPVENNGVITGSELSLTSQPVENNGVITGSELSLTSQPVENNGVINGSKLVLTSQPGESNNHIKESKLMHISPLVEDNTLTPEQRKEIKKRLKKARKYKRRKEKNNYYKEFGFYPPDQSGDTTGHVNNTDEASQTVIISGKAQESDSKMCVEMAIMKNNFPAEKFTEEDSLAIKKRIIEEVNTSDSQSLPIIEQTKSTFGVLLVYCKDSGTAEWLKRTFNNNSTVLPDCTLKVTLSSEMPRVARISLKTDDITTTDPVIFLKRIERLNPEYKATKWGFRKRQENYSENKHVSTSWSFEIDYDIVNTIKAKGQFAYTGLSKSYINILVPPKNNSELFCCQKINC